MTACCILGATIIAPTVQAQDVHKCTVNGQVTYQAKACGATDTVVPIDAGPSAQELRDAKGDLYRQRFQAATGHLMPPPPRPMPPYVAPPAPSGQTLIVSPTATTTTTTTIFIGPSRNTIIRTTRTRVATQAEPRDNCEKLNRDNGEALDRRDALQAPGELASRQALLQKAQGDLDHVRSMAGASGCKLTR